MDTLKYYGQGNGTQKDSSLPSSYYDVRQKILVVNPQIEVPLLGPLRGRVGVLFKHASSVDNNSGIIAATQPEGSGGMSLGSGEVGLVMDTRTGYFPFRRGVSL